MYTWKFKTKYPKNINLSSIGVFFLILIIGTKPVGISVPLGLTTISFPLFSGKLASLIAATVLAPDDIPTWKSRKQEVWYKLLIRNLQLSILCTSKSIWTFGSYKFWLAQGKYAALDRNSILTKSPSFNANSLAIFTESSLLTYRISSTVE